MYSLSMKNSEIEFPDFLNVAAGETCTGTHFLYLFFAEKVHWTPLKTETRFSVKGTGRPFPRESGNDLVPGNAFHFIQ